MQKPGAVSLNDSHVGKQIEIHSEFGEENDEYDPFAEDIVSKMSVWCRGTIVVVDEESESAWVEWDAIPSVGYPATRVETDFPSYNYNNGNAIGSWRFVVDVDYGV
jgi:hypothetical protein